MIWMSYEGIRKIKKWFNK